MLSSSYILRWADEREFFKLLPELCGVLYSLNTSKCSKIYKKIERATQKLSFIRLGLHLYFLARLKRCADLHP